jgi:hypothetical protein
MTSGFAAVLLAVLAHYPEARFMTLLNWTDPIVASPNAHYFCCMMSMRSVVCGSTASVMDHAK